LTFFFFFGTANIQQVEQGSRNHQIVPTTLIASIASLSSGRSHVPRHISILAKLGLIAKVQNARYDGYRLTYGGYDYLALHTHSRSDVLSGVGERIGVGKEADIMVVSSPSTSQDGVEVERVMKMHRLGRISFRTVKNNRDYLRKRNVGTRSWMYLSKLAAQKEHAVLKALWDVGFDVPQPVAYNRHTIVMERINGLPLRQVSSVPDPAVLYDKLMDMILQLAGFGLIHGDFNEFNIIITEVETPKSSASKGKTTAEETEITLRPIVIDFPQTLSTSHANAAEYFARDVACIKRFFSRRFGYDVDTDGPTLADIIKDPAGRRLDVEVEASGFTKKMAAELEGYLKESVLTGEGEGEDEESASDVEEAEQEETEEYPEDDESNGQEVTEEPAVPETSPVPVVELKKMSLADRFDDSASMISTRSRRNVANPAKVASGWAI
jgi:RIO kinase 2